jgi:hypothetical protein
MKKQYIGLLMVIIGVCSACSLEQEFTIAPKAKKKYISEQQDLEMDGDIIISGTNATGALADASKAVFLVIKSSLDRVNAHVDGEKSGWSKVERTERYAIKKKIMHELERSVAEIQRIQQRLDGFMVELDQKIQTE